MLHKAASNQGMHFLIKALTEERSTIRALDIFLIYEGYFVKISRGRYVENLLWHVVCGARTSPYVSPLWGEHTQ